MKAYFHPLILLSLTSMFILATGCTESSNEDTGEESMYDGELSLPSVTVDGLGCDPSPVFSGGDLMREFDRIALGTITRIEVEDQLNHPWDECSTSSVTWTLYVHVDVSENFKGTGENLVFSIGGMTTSFWSSRPLHLRDGRWSPDPFAPPTVQLSQDLGWSDESGLQVGQDLFVMLYERPNGLSPFSAPIGELVDGKIRFNSNQFAGQCPQLHEDLTSGLTVDEMRQEFTTPESAPSYPSPFEVFSHADEVSRCSHESVGATEPSQEEHEGTDPAMRTEAMAND